MALMLPNQNSSLYFLLVLTNLAATAGAFADQGGN